MSALVITVLAAALPVVAVRFWLWGRTEGRRENDLLEVHNERLRVKNRQLHESNARLAAERRDLEEFLAVVVPSDWEETS